MVEIGHKSTGLGWLAYDRDETVVPSGFALKVAHINFRLCFTSVLSLLPNG